MRDEPPDEFVVVGERDLVGAVKGRTVMALDNYVRPRRQGDYRFCDLNPRWRGPWGLVIRQARFPAAADVKAYPDLRAVRKYDLLQRMRLSGARR